MQAIYGVLIEEAAIADTIVLHIHDGLRDKAFKESRTTEWIEEQLSEAKAATEMAQDQRLFSRNAAFFPEDSRDIAEKYIASAQKQFEKEVLRRKNLLEENLEKVYETYLEILVAAPQLGEEVMVEEEERQSRHIKPEAAPASRLRLGRNSILKRIEESALLKQLAVKKGIGKDSLSKLMRDVYRQNLSVNDNYKAYLEERESEESDLKVVKWLVRTFLPSSPAFHEHLDAKPFEWSELMPAVTHLLHDTMKAWKDPLQEPLPLLLQDADFEDDVAFQKELFDRTLELWDSARIELNGLIDNWELSRLAQIDAILLVMAMVEFLNFPGIPIKVTINEYLEIAKQYSTPQSKQFLNGVLDKLSEKLAAEKRIKKSALGMMDSK